MQPGRCRPASTVGALDANQVIAGPGETMDRHRVAAGCMLIDVAVGVDRDQTGAIAEVPGLRSVSRPEGSHLERHGITSMYAGGRCIRGMDRGRKVFRVCRVDNLHGGKVVVEM